MIFLVLFVVFSLVGGSLQFGPTTIRVYVSCILILYLIARNSKFRNLYVSNKPIILYVAFLAIAFVAKILSMITNGVSIDETQFFYKRILSLYLVAIVGYYAVSYIAYSERRIKVIFGTLISIGCLNALVSYLQYIGNPYGLWAALVFNSGEGDYMQTYMNLTGAVKDVNFVVPGIFGHGAINGYMNSSLGILPVYLMYQSKFRIRVIGFIAFVMAVIGSFVTQERSGFGLLLLFSTFILFKFTKRPIQVILVTTVSLTLLFFSGSILNMLTNNEVGRYSNFGEFGDDRHKLVTDAVDFIKEHWIFGGEELYSSIGGITPHNFFLHALIFSGIVGLIIISILFFRMIKDCYYSIQKAPSAKNCSLYLGSALGIYLLNGLFHSGSLITGDVLIWILYGLLLRSERVEKIKSLS